jgi:hypothetical protein
VIAFETARHLRLNGFDVKGVLLIDSPSPLNHTPLSDGLLDYVVNQNEGYGACSDIGKLVKAQFRMNSCLFGNYDPYSSQGLFPPVTLLRSSEGFNPSDLSDVPLWLADRTNPEQVVAGWENLIGSPIKVWAIPGNHFRPFEVSNVSHTKTVVGTNWIGIDKLGRLHKCLGVSTMHVYTSKTCSHLDNKLVCLISYSD